jgi:hypothetical protein
MEVIGAHSLRFGAESCGSGTVLPRGRTHKKDWRWKKEGGRNQEMKPMGEEFFWQISRNSPGEKQKYWRLVQHICGFRSDSAAADRAEERLGSKLHAICCAFGCPAKLLLAAGNASSTVETRELPRDLQASNHEKLASHRHSLRSHLLPFNPGRVKTFAPLIPFSVRGPLLFLPFNNNP